MNRNVSRCVLHRYGPFKGQRDKPRPGPCRPGGEFIPLIQRSITPPVRYAPWDEDVFRVKKTRA